MRLATIKLGGAEVAGIVTEKGILPIHALNAATGTAWKENRTLVVPDVHQFPGHIACSSLSQSEIVVPLHGPGGKVSAVLDIDSDQLATFDETDALWLEKIGMIVATK